MDTDDAQGEQSVMKQVNRGCADWQAMEGMFRGGGSLTEALLEERAAEKAHDDARAKGH
jgi:hypothetical protein